MRAASRHNGQAQRANVAQHAPSQGSHRSYVFSAPSWGPLPSRDRRDQREDKGNWGAQAAARASKFTINEEKGVVAQVYYSLSAAIFAKFYIDSNSLK